MDKATSFIFCPSLGHCRSYEIRNCSQNLFALGMQFYVTARLDNCIAYMVKFYDFGLQFYVTECASTIHFCLNLDNPATDASIQCKEALIKRAILDFLCTSWAWLEVWCNAGDGNSFPPKSKPRIGATRELLLFTFVSCGANQSEAWFLDENWMKGIAITRITPNLQSRSASTEKIENGSLY